MTGLTMTKGEMAIGAGTVAAQKYGDEKLIDPRPTVSGEIKRTFDTFPKIGVQLPAMGYSKKPIKDLEGTINRVTVDAVIIRTPIDLARIVNIAKPAYRLRYDPAEISQPNLRTVLAEKSGRVRKCAHQGIRSTTTDSRSRNVQRALEHSLLTIAKSWTADFVNDHSLAKLLSRHPRMNPHRCEPQDCNCGDD